MPKAPGPLGSRPREAARLDSFIRTLGQTVGNQVDMAEGGAAGITDRAGNERLGRIVNSERLTRMQGLLRSHGIEMSKRQIAMDQNGDFSLNLTPATARQMHHGGLINDSQLGAVANGGSARFSFAHNDLLVSSSAGFQQSARSDTSTRFEAGKQAGPDTIEHFLGGGAEGHAAMANWLKGGFEMDRQGHWRLKPQVADTLQRDVQAIMAQTGWQRSITRNAEDNTTIGTQVGASVSGGVHSQSGSQRNGVESTTGGVSGSLGFTSVDRGTTSESARAALDVINHDVRSAITSAQQAALRSQNPQRAFAEALADTIIGTNGLRDHYLRQADSARGTADITSPFTSIEQSSVLTKGRFSDDLANGPFDGNTSPPKDED